MHYRKYANLLQVRWLDSQFQSAVEHVTLGVIQKGIDNYDAVTRQKSYPDWQILVAPDAENEIEVNDASELIETDVFEEFDPSKFLPTSLEEVETIKSMRFLPSGEAEAPG